MSAASSLFCERKEVEEEHHHAKQSKQCENSPSPQRAQQDDHEAVVTQDISQKSNSNDDAGNLPLLEQSILLRKENTALKTQRDEALNLLNTAHEQQRTLCENFKLLRNKYDDLKSLMNYAVWEYIPRNDLKNTFSELRETNAEIFETPDRIGQYVMGATIGEGQFGNVKICENVQSTKKYAIKIIKKNKVVSVAGVHRVQREISVLRKVNHPNIVKLVDVVNTPKCVYMVIQLGGTDLFDFFNHNSLGVDPSVAREIILGISLPLAYLHSIGICHRDLKPENVLLRQSANTNKLLCHQNVQLCDFGQCAENCQSNDSENQWLTELCGSPGFFAPEMILWGEKYNGNAVDMWSLGCIMLELTRGHNAFCKLWMSSYDHNIMLNEKEFERSIREAVTNVNSAVLSEDEISINMNDLMRKLLVIEPSMRIKSKDILSEPWLCHIEEEQVLKDGCCSQSNESGDMSLDETPICCEGDHSLSKHTFTIPHTPRDTKPKFSISMRARRRFTGSSVEANETYSEASRCSRMSIDSLEANDESQIKLCLPPIEPKTPSRDVGKIAFTNRERVLKKYQNFIDYKVFSPKTSFRPCSIHLSPQKLDLTTSK